MKINRKDKDKDIDKIKLKKEETKSNSPNIFVFTVIIVIIITFIFTGSAMLGLSSIFGDLGKEKIKNEDGTISIPDDAQILGADISDKEARNKYMAKVYGKTIQLFRKDELNQKINNILNYEGIPDFQKIQWIRSVYDQEIDKIVGLYNAKKMNIDISKDYLTKEVGIRFYDDDKDGEIDTYKMRKEENIVNQYADKLVDELLFENFKKDYFEGLPVSYEEVSENYKLDNTQITLEYIDILNDEISKDKLKEFYDNNKENYKQYKLIRLFFKSKDLAAENLNTLKQDPSKFVEIGQKLKNEDKVINIKYDAEYYFIDELTEPRLGETVKQTQVNGVGDQIIESELGSFIFLVERIIYGDIEETKTYEKAKKDYLVDNYETINKNNKEKADNIYQYALKNDLENAGAKFKYELITSSPSLFMGYNIPHVNPDETDDINYMVEVFKGKKGDVLKPYKHENGYMIATIIEKDTITEENIDTLYNDLVSRYSNNKTQRLEQDYYKNKRKKAKIVDNFRFVNFQMLMPKKEPTQ